MKARRFDYVRAGTLAEACAALAAAGDDGRVLAGGQSLVPMMNFRVAGPAVLVDVNRCAELAGISVADGRVRVGALTRHRETERSAEIAALLPPIALAMPHVAHIAVRNRGTFGGSLAHADPAAELPACALLLEGRMILRSTAGERAVPADEFFLGAYETAARPDEVLAAAEFEAAPPEALFAFREVARRHGDFALAGIVARARRASDGGMAAPAFVAFGVGDRPVRLPAVAALVAAGASDRAALRTALAEDVAFEDDGHHAAAYRAHLAAHLVETVLADLRAAARREAD